MCGRFAVTTDPARLAAEIDAVDETGSVGWTPNYNVAPTTEVAAAVDADGRRVRLMRWGLVPHWAKPGAPPLINARAETLSTSPAFRVAAGRARCLVAMDGYYEWKPNPDNPKRGGKTPFYFFRPDGSPLLVAAVWTASPSPACCIVTTEARGEFADIHARMPLIVAEPDWDRWLDPSAPAPAELLAGPPAAQGIAIREVSTLVNRVANNGPELIEPVDRGNQPVGLF